MKKKGGMGKYVDILNSYLETTEGTECQYLSFDKHNQRSHFIFYEILSDSEMGIVDLC